VSVEAGIAETKLAALAEYENSSAFSDRERAALRFATTLVRDRAVSDTAWAQLRAQFSEPEIVELVFAIGYQTFAGQFAAAFQIAPQGFAKAAGGESAQRQACEAV
jgi:alkylhydroperoxidase family enzyme